MTAVGAPWCALVPTVMALRRIQAGEVAIMLDYMTTCMYGITTSGT